MVGDADGNAGCGFAVLDAKTFEVKGRWENGGPTPVDELRLLVPAAQERARLAEFGAPNAYENGFDLDDVAAGRYGQRMNFWNLEERTLEQTIDFGEQGLVPLEIRWLHDPEAEEGFVGAALSSSMWRFHRSNGSWSADPVITVEGVELEGWPFPVPGAHHRPRPLDGRQGALLLQLAARRPAPLRRLRPGQPEADGQALARRRARPPERRRARARTAGRRCCSSRWTASACT